MIVETTAGWDLPNALYNAPRKNNSSARPLITVMKTISHSAPWLANSST